MGRVSRSSVVSAMVRATVLCLGVAITLVYAQDYEDVVLPVSGSPAQDFKCPKQDGKFRDNEYCDLYYVCKNGETEQEVDPLEVDGFTCPATSNSGPAGSANPQHTIYPHPYKCPFYFSCYNNKYPNLFGCPEADKQVFHPDKKRCVSVEDGPDYCKCYYDDTGCPSCPSGQSCLEDCTCGDPDALYEDEYPTNN